MALLTVQVIGKTALDVTYAAASTSDTFEDDGSERTFLHIKNSNAATRDISIAAPNTDNVPGVGPYTIPAITKTIAANTGDCMIGPFPSKYINPTTGLVTVTFTASAGVTVRPIKLPRLS